MLLQTKIARRDAACKWRQRALCYDREVITLGTIAYIVADRSTVRLYRIDIPGL